MGAVDYTSRISPAALKAAGVTDVFRYLCYSPVGDWKNITKPEYDELIAAGIGVTLNWEFRSTDWNNGYSVGKDHGTTAGRMAEQLGYPKGCTIFGSADYDMQQSDWDIRGQYYALGFAEGVKSYGYAPGVYGPWDVLQWVYGRYGWYCWQAGMSTSWSHGRNAQAYPRASVRQRRYVTIGGVQTDWNDILIPNWGQARKGQTMADLTLRQQEQLSNADVYLWQGLSKMADPIPGILASGDGKTTSTTPNAFAQWAKRIESKIDALATPHQVSLTDSDRDLINRAVDALASATPLTTADMTTIGQVRDLLGVIAGHLR